MLTQLLTRDETIASLGKTEDTFAVHISGEMIGQHCPETFAASLNSFHSSMDRKKRS
jgi:hypothetical protein